MSKCNLKQEIKENLRKNKILLIVFTIIWIVLISLTLTRYGNTLGKRSTGVESYNRSVVEINKENSISAIVPIEEDAESVSVMLATYARNSNSGNVTFTIKGIQSGIEYYRETVNVLDIEDNAYRSFELKENLKGINDSQLAITIFSDSEVNHGIGVYYSNVKYFETESMFSINSKEIENADLMTRYLFHDEAFSNFSRMVIICSIIGLSMLALIVLLINPKPEVLFAIFAFVLGMIFMVIIVPMSPPDEQTHYEISLVMSNKVLCGNTLVDEAYLKYGSMYGHYNISAGYSRFLDEIFGSINLREKYVDLGDLLEGRYLMQYFPQTLGIIIGRLCGFNMLTTFYIGRLFNLLFYCACVYFVVKLAPGYKFLLGMILILPMFIQTAISFSYDVFIYGMSFLTFVYYLRWMFIDEKIKTKDLIIVFVVSTLLAPAKVVYGFLTFLFWLVPKNRFKNTKIKIFYTIAICGSACYQLFDIMYSPLKQMLGWLEDIIVNDGAIKTIQLDNINNTIFSQVNGGISTNIYKEEMVYGFEYIVNHPLKTIAIFYRTVRYRLKFWFYGFMGRELSGGTLIIPLQLVHVLSAIVVASCLIKEDYIFPIPMKILHLLVCIVIGLYILVGFFVTWTENGQLIIDDYGGTIVEGIQGRYFNPFIMYVLTILSNKKINIPKKIDKYIILTYIPVFFMIVVYVLSYTFVN